MFKRLFPEKHYFMIIYKYDGIVHDTMIHAKHQSEAAYKFYKKHDSNCYSIKNVIKQDL